MKLPEPVSISNHHGNLFTESQLRELLSKQEALMRQALEVIELHPYPGWIMYGKLSKH